MYSHVTVALRVYVQNI